jgi:beta-ribofuranosylaminobenzene 5'-phosphate synthase
LGFRIQAHARLHVCLLDMNGSLGRINGSVGFSVSEPVLELTARSDDGHSFPRYLGPYVRAYEKVEGSTRVRLEVKKRFETHVGLGFTTQAALSTGAALDLLRGKRVNVRKLALIMGRGGTSGVGVASFEGGGALIIDLGHKTIGMQEFLPSGHTARPPATVFARLPLPAHMRFVMAIPRAAAKRVSGSVEVKLFRRFAPVPSEQVERLSRLILFKLLPGALEGDIGVLGEAVDDVQKLGFKKLEVEYQGEPVIELMKEGRRLGAAGSGMSSFGPSVYFVCSGDREARSVSAGLSPYAARVYVASPWNRGALMERLPE